MLLGRVHRPAERHVRAVRLGRGREIHDRLSEGELSLGRSEEVIGLFRRERDGQGARIRQSHVLGGNAHHPAGHVQRILAPREHPRQPVERAFDVGSAHGLVQGGDEVEVLFAGFVVGGEGLLEHGLYQLGGKGNGEWGKRRRVLEDRLERVERPPRVPLRMSHQEFQSLFSQLDLSPFPIPLSLGADRPVDHVPYVGVGEGLEHEYPAARQQCPGQLEAGVLRGGADQRDDAVLDPRKERVLLRPVEAVDLVAEQNGAASFVLEALLRLLDDLTHAGHPLGDRGERLEVPLRVVRDQPGEGRLARAGRAPEDARPDVAATDQLAQRLPRPEQVLLAEKILEARRPHAGGERLGGAGEEGGIRHRGKGNGERGMGTRISWPRSASSRSQLRSPSILLWWHEAAGVAAGVDLRK